MKKELLLAFLSVAINGSAANDEIVKAGSTAVPMPQYAVFTDGLHDDIVPGGWLKFSSMSRAWRSPTRPGQSTRHCRPKAA